MQRRVFPLVCLAALPLTGIAQQKAPIANYWISTETATGFGPTTGGGAPGLGDMARMMMGSTGGGDGYRNLLLQLGSQRTANDPEAKHDIPRDLKMGSTLPLLSPRRVNRSGETQHEDDTYEKPKGKIYLYWGCGEQAGPGQPLVIDFAKLAAGKGFAVFAGRHIAQPTGPSSANSRSYGTWPNEKDATRVPSDASLRGDHLVQGNYTPDIRFSLDDSQDFLAPVSLSMKKTGAQAMNVSWKSIPRATGYYASTMGSKDGSEDMVWWTSSTSKEMGETLFNYLSNSEAARLVKEKVILPPTATECTVPAQVLAAAPSAMFRFIAYGEESNLVYPPKPKDPKQRWEPEWAVKVRHKSTASTVLEEGAGTGAASSRGGRSTESPAEGVGTSIIRGLFGF